MTRTTIFTDAQLATIDRNAPVTFGFVIAAIERLAELDNAALDEARNAGAVAVTSAFPLIEMIGSALVDTAIDRMSDTQQRHTEIDNLETTVLGGLFERLDDRGEYQQAYNALRRLVELARGDVADPPPLASVPPVVMNETGVYPVYPELPSTLLFDDGVRVRCSTNGKAYEKRGGAWQWIDEKGASIPAGVNHVATMRFDAPPSYSESVRRALGRE